ncbi:sterile alpha motif domain-containing protein 14 isoform X3 [Phyllostomus discolor]|uniref:Sterile alpha motif domain-containing protein 14 isoform X3 n=1 Tax=Phyllostomus discolor TaxID=89673 RepID=A0A6J2MEA8_9CHIR|nr:sterile alpha motif domain-containing protein 14 isoform X3 [Phyllostomus discolor]
MLELSGVMASSKLREPADEVFDLDLAVPETVRLDSSLHKARAQLLAKGRRHRPSRSRLRDSASSAEDGEGSDGPGGKVTDGCGSPLHRLRSPLHSSPGSPAVGSFCLDPPGLRRSLDEDEPPPSPLTRYRPLHNAASHEGLAAASSSPPRSAPSSDSSPSFVRRHLRAEPHSEDDSRDASPPEPASPTIGLDKKTRRKFLDLGVTLRRASTSKSRKEKGSNRLSMGSRESVEGSGRSGGSPFLPFSWFTDSGKGSASSGSTTSPACSPKHESFSPKKSASQAQLLAHAQGALHNSWCLIQDLISIHLGEESTLSDDSTPPSSSPKIPSGPRQEAKCSYPYHTLSQSSDEFLDEPLPTIHHWTSQQVGQWLHSLNLEQYATEFAARQVDGPQLLQLDGSKLKSLGLSSSHDRALVKRKVKELAAAAEKERKAQEKAARQREKLRRREQEAKKS